ncbi:MAG: hypothetical protein HAW59_06710 [Betaproteobacteria bacterium]|nr:hypothetical protein [Betaproteobacteria bacterium]
MSVHPLNENELSNLRQRYYFFVLEEKFNEYRRRHGVPAAADYLTAAIRDAEPIVNGLIEQRIKAGEIKDAGQTRKSLAGNGFQAIVFLAMVAMQEKGLIPPHVIFSLKPKNHALIKNYAVIQTGGEELKPDLDLMVHAENTDAVSIYSLKTSLRERAGQTHRWKLLMDIATAPDAKSIREKYDLRFSGGKHFFMNLITTNFYDEITAPQQRGLLRFFDGVYLTKPGSFAAPVLNFSRIAEDLTEIYGG